MKGIRMLPVAVLVALSTVLGAQSTLSIEAQLKAGINKEVVDGDCPGAIEIYKKVAAASNRAAAAQALLRMAGCYEKHGNAEAQKVYAQIVSDFGDQPQATEARARLAPSGPGPTATLTPRLVWTQRPDEPGKIESLSSDGRMAAMIRTINGVDDIGLRDMVSGHVRWLGVTKSTDDDIYGALLSPDHRQVVYSDDLTTHTEFFIVATEGRATPKQLISNRDISDVIPAAWSADGKSVLTAISRQDRTWQIAWVSADTGDITGLKSIDWRFRYDVDGLSLSPDGRYIAYSALATNPSQPRPAPPESTETHVYVLATDLSSETELIKTPGINSQPVWTSDGGNLLYKSDQGGSTGLWSIPMSGGKAAGEPALVKPDLGDVTLMASTSAGSYFYTTQGRVERISIVNATLDAQSGTNAAAAAAETIVGFQPVWSPDGRSVALLRGFPSTRLVVHSLESREDRDYASDHLATGLPIWLHDGTAVLMLSSESSRPPRPFAPAAMYRVNLASGGVTEILAPDPDNRRAAVVGLSADDKTLYVTERPTKRVPGEPQAQPSRIIAIDLATGREELVFTAPDGGAIFNAQLSPDGRAVAMTIGTPSAGIDTIARVDVDGSGFRRLHALSPGERVALTWSHDGRVVLYAPARQPQRRVSRIPADGGQPEFTGLVLGGTGRFSVSPDGSRLAYASSDPAQQLWALDNLAAVVKGSR